MSDDPERRLRPPAGRQASVKQPQPGSNATPPLSANVTAQAGATETAKANPGAIGTVVDPLRAEVDALRAKVSRLEAALESLRLSVAAQQEAYAKHRHPVASYGITSAKSIVPNTPAIDGTMLVITTAAGPSKGLTGAPE